MKRLAASLAVLAASCLPIAAPAASPAPQLMRSASDTSALTAAIGALRQDLSAMDHAAYPTVGGQVCRDYKAALRSVTADLRDIRQAKLRVLSATERLAGPPDSSWLAAPAFNMASSSELRAVRVAKSDIAAKEARFRDSPPAFQSLRQFATALDASEQRLRHVADIGALPEHEPRAAGAPQASADLTDQSFRQATELQTAEDALRQAIGGFKRAADDLQRNLTAPCVQAFAVDAPPHAGLAGGDRPLQTEAPLATSSGSPIAGIAGEVSETRALTSAVGALRGDLDELYDGSQLSVSENVCRDHKSALGFVIADLEAVARAKARLLSAVARFSGTDWLAASAFNKAARDDLRAVQAAEAEAARQQDRFRDTPQVSASFGGLASQLDASAARLRRQKDIAIVPADLALDAAPPAYAVALTKDSRDLRQAVERFKTAVEAVQTEMNGDCPPGSPWLPPKRLLRRR